jgi:hypothetical protein
MRKRAWRRGRVLESKSENWGSRPGDVTFETIQLCRRSSTFVKVCRKSSIFIVKFSSGMSETFFDTCVNWSCVTRCGCRTTSSTLFTVCVFSWIQCWIFKQSMGARNRVEIVFVNVYEAQDWFWGINFARESFPGLLKRSTNMGSGYINWWNWFFGIYSWAP